MFESQLRYLDRAGRIMWHAAFGEGAEEPLQASRGHIGRVGLDADDDRHTFAAAVEKVVGGGGESALVGKGDVVDGCLIEGLTEEHGGGVDDQLVPVAVGQADGGHDESVVEPVPRRADGVQFGLPIGARLFDDDPISLHRRFLDEPSRELAEVRLVDLGNRESDRPCATGPEIAAATFTW